MKNIPVSPLDHRRRPGFSVRHYPRIFSAAAAVAAASLVSSAFAQTPLYQWNFDAGTGVSTGSGGGGNLTATVIGTGTAEFLVGGGVSGQVGDGSLATVNTIYSQTNAGIASTAAGDVLTGVGTLSRFTLTMWIKGDTALAGQQFARLFMAGPIANYDNTAANPGLYFILANGGIQYGVNGFTTTAPNTLPLAATGWNFLALVYDGVPTSPYFSAEMQAAVGTINNTALLLGGIETSVANVYNAGLSTGGPAFDTSPGAVALGASVYAFLANRSNFTRGFDGSMDDVRLYDGILDTAALETIRLSAIPEPGSAAMTLVGALGFGCLLRRRRVV